MVFGFVCLLILIFWLGPNRVIQWILQHIVPDEPDWRYALLLGVLIALIMVIPLPVVFIIIFVPGMVFGFWTAVLILLVAMSIGVTLAYHVGRWAFQDPMRDWMSQGQYRRFQSVLQTLESDEDTVMLLVLFRFLMMPYILKNYIPVLIRIPLWKLALTAIPHHIWVSVLFASLGSIFKDSAELMRKGGEWDWKHLKWQQMGIFAGALVSTMLISFYAYWIYRKKATDQTEENSERVPLLEGIHSSV